MTTQVLDILNIFYDTVLYVFRLSQNDTTVRMRSQSSGKKLYRSMAFSLHVFYTYFTTHFDKRRNMSQYKQQNRTNYSCNCSFSPIFFPFHYDKGGYILDVRFTLHNSNLTSIQNDTHFYYTHGILPDIQHSAPNLQISRTKRVYKNKMTLILPVDLYRCNYCSHVKEEAWTGEVGEKCIMGCMLCTPGREVFG